MYGKVRNIRIYSYLRYSQFWIITTRVYLPRFGKGGGVKEGKGADPEIGQFKRGRGSLEPVTPLCVRHEVATGNYE